MGDLTFASIMDGLGGSDTGAISQGYKPLWRVDKDNRYTGFTGGPVDYGSTMIAPLTLFDYEAMPSVDLLHVGAISSRDDTQGVIKAIVDIDPKCLTMETTKGFLSTDEWSRIIGILFACGYWVQYYNWNSYNFDVPKSRERLYIIALRGRAIELYQPCKGLVGWYEAIGEYLPGSKASRCIAPNNAEGTSMARMSTRKTGGDSERVFAFRSKDEPAFDTPSTKMNNPPFIYDADRRRGSRCRFVDIEMNMVLHTLPKDISADLSNIEVIPMIGKTVPPVLYGEIARQLRDVITGIE